jgi:Zn-dependent protease with chaperone function
MAQIGNLDFRAFVDDRKEKRVGGAEAPEVPYAYVSDRTTRAAFQKMKPVELAVAATVRLFKAVGKNELLGHAVKVGPRQFPRVHELAVRCSDTLGIAVPTMYIVNEPRMNAATYGTNDDSFILIHSGLIDHFTDEELLDVIGHECGHIHNSHVVYLTAMHYLTRMASMFVQWFSFPAVMALRAWSRRAEVTCDRAGMLCCKSLDVSTRSMAKLALGSQKLYSELNIETFLEQYDEGQEGLGRYSELMASHPFLPKRVLAMRAFAESDLWKKHVGDAGDGLDMNAVDEKVHGIIKVVG